MYLDGSLVAEASVDKFKPSLPVCFGSFVVGDSIAEGNSWDGDFHGLAIYQRELTSEQVLTDFRSWVKTNRPEESIVGGPDALYLFDEKAGEVVRDHGRANVNLGIPKQYQVVRQTLLELPASCFKPSWSYAKSILINIVRIPGQGEKDSGVNAKTIPG